MNLLNPMIMFAHRFPLRAASLLAALAGAAHADVRLSNIFSDHMVLQRDTPVRIWGSASPGEKVNVKFGSQSLSGTAGKDGAWAVVLAPLKANSNPQELTVAGNNTLTLADILIGDVWLCSGQSNMAFNLGSCKADADVKAADFPQIRHTWVPNHEGAQPMSELPEPIHWHVMSPATAPGCSAVGFYFARKINADTRIPIGILGSAQGGSVIESWMSPEAIDNYPENADLAKRYHAAIDDWRSSLPLDELKQWLATSTKALADAHVITPPDVTALAKWHTAAVAALTAHSEVAAPPDPEGLNKWLAASPVTLPPIPAIPGHPLLKPKWFPGAHLYNARIAPLTRFPIKGMLWYQGENGSGNLYYHRFRSMIETMRKYWSCDFPVYFVQLPNLGDPQTDPKGDGNEGFPNTRMEQFKCLLLPKTGMAVTIDVGDPKDIHPSNKKDVGERLALWALARDYDRKIVCSGPLYKSLRIENNKIRISFDHADDGLMVGRKDGLNPVIEDKGVTLKRFAIAGEDKKWVWADAVIDGGNVVVSNTAVPKPVAVRYAYSMNPEGCNLYNKDGLPASPFRSDHE